MSASRSGEDVIVVENEIEDAAELLLAMGNMSTSTTSTSHSKSSLHEASSSRQGVETDATEAVILDDGLQAFPIPAVKLNAPITLKESWNRLRRRGDGNCLFYSLLGRDDALAAAQLRGWVAKWIVENRHVTLDGLTVQRWITEMNPRMSVEQYSESLKARMWGGVLEIRVLSQMCNWSIIAMQERDAHHYVECLRILPRFSVLSESKYILFVDGCHFDELQPITGSSYAQSWQPFPEFEENIHVPTDTNANSQVQCSAS